MTRKEELLIEKVIWLIEDSYPDTDEWGHDALVEKIKESLETRADELKRMFGDSEIPTSPWHKASEELPKDTCEVLICWETVNHERKWTQKVMFYRDVNNSKKGWFEDEDECRPEPDYWIPIPELPKED